jgi:secreted Zn-dependent insulinase-like peptidase
MSIEMGHFSDPDDCQGLSHLMEHMLFAGSQHYPDGNFLNTLLNSHGGFVNAWTAAESCNVHFNCPANLFEESLDVLIDMLTRPNLSIEGIAQEVDAIDAEFSMRKQDDVRRLYDVHKQTCNPKHPFSRFNVGNKKIFNQFSKAELQRKLREHHQQHFDAKRIKTCIVLPQKMADKELIANIEQKLSEFTYSNVVNISTNSPELYLKEQKACLIEVKPYKFAQNLMLTFCLPNIAAWYRSKPILILTHLIEDASENTLQHYLKREGLILDLTASGGIEGKNFQDININLRLTELGLQNTHAIIQNILQWFDFLRETGIEKWRFEEKSHQLALQVKHSPLPSGIDEAVMLASKLHKLSLKEALESEVAMDCYDEKVFTQFLAYFSFENLRVFCIHPKAKCNLKTTQYEVPYSLRAFELSQSTTSTLSLELPPKNPYMSDNFALLPKELEPSELRIIKSSDFLLKFTQNHQFKTPKGDCYLSLENPNMIGSARNLAIKKLWIACLSEELSEAYSGAEMAGINFRLYGHQGGMTLHTSGFSDRQLMLCEEILGFIQTLQITQATFAGVKEKLTTSLKNTLLNKPINQLFSDLNILMQENTFSQDAILTEVLSLELDDLHLQASTYFEKIHIEGLVVGNWSVAQITAFHTKVVDCFKDMDRILKSSRNIAQLNNQQLCIQHKQSHQEHAIVLYFQCATNSDENRGLYIAIEKLLSPIFFDELRNKKNLGYLVGCGYFPVNKRPGLAVYIQSPTHSSDKLYTAMVEVIQDFVDNIADFEPIFDNFKESLKKQFRVFDANTNQLAQRLWMDFDELQSSTENNQMEIVINALTFDLFRQACEQLCNKNSLGKVAFITAPEADTKNSFAGLEFIDDPSKFKPFVEYH